MACLHKVFGSLGRQSVCPHQTIDWVSPQRRRCLKDDSSDSRDVCVCSAWQRKWRVVKARGRGHFGFCKNWPLWQYHFTLDIAILLLYNCLCVCVCGCGGALVWGHQCTVHSKHRQEKTRVTVKNRGIKRIWEENRETKGPISTSAKT